MEIVRANESDLREILELQYAAYQSEAVLLNNFDIPPLKQTYDEVLAEYGKGLFLKAVDGNGGIIGSVRAYIKDGTAYVGKLIVRPEMQDRGIGTELVRAVERECPAARHEIFTSDKSLRTIKLYERLGYNRFREEKVSDGLTLVYLEKHSAG